MQKDVIAEYHFHRDEVGRVQSVFWLESAQYKTGFVHTEQQAKSEMRKLCFLYRKFKKKETLKLKQICVK